MKLWKHGSQKPPLGAQINWERASASGLVFDALLNEGAGGSACNLAQSMVGSVEGGAEWCSHGMTFDGSNDDIVFPVSPAWSLNSPFSIMLRWRRIVRTGGGFPNSIGTWTGTAGDNGWCMYSSATVSFLRNGISIAIKAVTDYVWYQLGVIYDGVNAISFVDGICSTPVAKDWPLSLATTRQLWLAWRGTGDRDTADLEYARIWNRELSSSEVAEFYVQPYGGDLYVVPGPRIWKIGFVPLAMNYYRRLRGN